MKKVIVFLMVLGLFVGGNGLSQASIGWHIGEDNGVLQTPVLGYGSNYDGNVNILTTTGYVVIPYADPTSPPNVGASMNVFTVGQEVHSGSGVNVDNGVDYQVIMSFMDLTNPLRNISSFENFTGSGGFWMTWTTPAVGGDGLGLPALTNADIGNWLYRESYSLVVNGLPGASILYYETPFTVTGVPEPATMLLLGLGLVGLAGIRRKFKG